MGSGWSKMTPVLLDISFDGVHASVWPTSGQELLLRPSPLLVR